MAPARPSLSTLILTLQGVVLGLGAGSALFVSQVGLGARLGLSRTAVEWTYALGAAGLVVLGALLLLAARVAGRWPLQPSEATPDIPAGVEIRNDANSEAPRPADAERALTRSGWLRYGATLLAGLGTGAYAGLLNHVDWGPMHLATAIAYFALVPLAFLAVVLGERTLWPACARLVALMAAVEVSAQLGLWWSQDRAYFDDLTGIDVAYLAGGLVFAALVAVARACIRTADRTAADRAPT